MSSKEADDAGGDILDQIPGDQRGCNPSLLQTPYRRKRIRKRSIQSGISEGMKAFQIHLVNT